MVAAEPLYLVYNLYFVGDPTVRSLILPVPPMVDPVAYQAMVEADGHRMLRLFVRKSSAGISFYRDAWFPAGEPELITDAECRARFPDAVRDRERRDGGHDAAD